MIDVEDHAAHCRMAREIIIKVLIAIFRWNVYWMTERRSPKSSGCQSSFENWRFSIPEPWDYPSACKSMSTEVSSRVRCDGAPQVRGLRNIWVSLYYRRTPPITPMNRLLESSISLELPANTTNDARGTHIFLTEYYHRSYSCKLPFRFMWFDRVVQPAKGI